MTKTLVTSISDHKFGHSILFGHGYLPFRHFGNSAFSNFVFSATIKRSAIIVMSNTVLKFHNKIFLWGLYIARTDLHDLRHCKLLYGSKMKFSTNKKIVCVRADLSTCFIRKKSKLQKSEHRKPKRLLKMHQSIRTSNVSIEVIRMPKLFWLEHQRSTYGVLPMDTKACGGLG